MLMGLAYATGCATCFGAAVLLECWSTSASWAPFTGAAVMFLFSVGMGIPLVIGASLMAQVLPLLERFTSASRYLALASSAMMLAMAVLLLSDHFMGFSNGVAQMLGGARGRPAEE
jgi:cytochrome c biogenesis protein CcdA